MPSGHYCASATNDDNVESFSIEKCPRGTFRVKDSKEKSGDNDALRFDHVGSTEADICPLAETEAENKARGDGDNALLLHGCQPCANGTHTDSAGGAKASLCLECAIETRCEGGCTEGHTGALCGKCCWSDDPDCTHDYYEFQNNCRRCPGTYEWCDCKIPWMFIIVLVILVLICLAAAKGDMSRWEVVAAMKQVTTYAQPVTLFFAEH